MFGNNSEIVTLPVRVPPKALEPRRVTAATIAALKRVFFI
jgi:hypothetical protein